MEHDWKRLGRAFAAAREAAGLTQVDVAKRIDVSRQPIQAIERGVPHKKPTGTMRSYARLLGWTEDSIEDVLAGGEPTMAAPAARPEPSPEPSDTPPPATRAPIPGLPLVVMETMADGVIWDTEIEHVTEGGADLRVIRIAVLPANEPPEQRQKNRQAWEAAKPQAKASERGEPGSGD